VLATGAVVLHKYSQSSSSLSSLKVYLVERNHYWVAVKNFPPGQLLMLPFFTLLRYFKQAMIVAAGTGTGAEFRSAGSKGDIAKAMFKALFEAVAGTPKAFSKRQQVLKTKNLSWSEFSRLLDKYRISFDELLDNK
jgi:GT2 family glycosyltransferase